MRARYRGILHWWLGVLDFQVAEKELSLSRKTNPTNHSYAPTLTEMSRKTRSGTFERNFAVVFQVSFISSANQGSDLSRISCLSTIPHSPASEKGRCAELGLQTYQSIHNKKKKVDCPFLLPFILFQPKISGVLKDIMGSKWSEPNNLKQWPVFCSCSFVWNCVCLTVSPVLLAVDSQ